MDDAIRSRDRNAKVYTHAQIVVGKKVMGFDKCFVSARRDCALLVQGNLVNCMGEVRCVEGGKDRAGGRLTYFDGSCNDFLMPRRKFDLGDELLRELLFT